MGIAVGRDAESKSCWVSRSNSRNGSVRINIAITPPLSMVQSLPRVCSATSLCSLWYPICQVEKSDRRVVRIGAEKGGCDEQRESTPSRRLHDLGRGRTQRYRATYPPRLRARRPAYAGPLARR